MPGKGCPSMIEYLNIRNSKMSMSSGWYWDIDVCLNKENDLMNCSWSMEASSVSSRAASTWLDLITLMSRSRAELAFPCSSLYINHIIDD